MKSLYNISSELTVAIDIETVRVKKSFEELSEGYKESWRYKHKQDGVIPTPEELSVLWEKKASLYAEFSKVCAVSLAFIYRDTVHCREFYGNDEKSILTKLSETLNRMVASNSQYRLIAHAGKFFDFPYLCKRFIINGINMPDILDVTNLKPWEQRNLCTNELWRLGGTGAGSSLKALCNVLDIPDSKADLEGDEVGRVYYEGDYRRIGRYCSHDAIATLNIFRRFKSETIFKFEDVEYLNGLTGKEDMETPCLLTKIWNTKNITEEDIEEIKAKKLTKAERAIGVDILKALSIQEMSFIVGDIEIIQGDKKEIRETKEEICEKLL